MTIPQMKLCEQFAEGILQHFKRLNIVGKHILENETVKVQILAYGKTISTTIPLRVILNIVSTLESWKIARYEIIKELTNGLTDACVGGKNVNGSNTKRSSLKKRKKRKIK